MKRYLIIMTASLCLASCEVFRIDGGAGKPVKEVVEVNRLNPSGTIYLFKMELDNENVPSATSFFASSGSPMMAIDQVDFYDEVARLNRMLNKKPITRIIADTLDTDIKRLRVEFDMIHEYDFTTQRIRNEWYITGYQKLPKRY